jgi:hypothetical protein
MIYNLQAEKTQTHAHMCTSHGICNHMVLIINQNNYAPGQFQKNLKVWLKGVEKCRSSTQKK